MRIAQIAPLYEAVPPRLYGGTERIIAHLCDALADLGHDVTLFAAGGSRTAARLVAAREQALRLDPSRVKSDVGSHLNMLCEVRRRCAQFDILHFHIDMSHFPFFEPQAKSTVTTVHGRLDGNDLPPVYAHWQRFGLVSVSDAQRRPLPNANWLATVSHGIPPPLYTFTERNSGKYLAFLGRLAPEKGVDRAVRVALLSEMRLQIAAKIDSTDTSYFDTVVRPLLRHSAVDFIGEIGDGSKSEFLGEATALLFPIDWPEPFGLVMIEAMACGTPVIAWNRGAVPEVVEDNVTGFIVNSEEEALAAIARARHIDRRRVRAGFERRFTAAKMAKAYLDVYEDCRMRSRGPYIMHRAHDP